jgi:hypothetical protein
MTPDEARARETRDWLAKAAEDIASCKALMLPDSLPTRFFLPAGR